MSFAQQQNQEAQHNPALVQKPPNAPTKADSTVLLAGLMGLRPRSNPSLSTAFSVGNSGGLGRRPGLQKRLAIGGA